MATTEAKEVQLQVAAGAFGQVRRVGRKAQGLGLSDRSPHFPLRCRAAQIGDRAGGKRYRDASAGGDGGGGESGAAMHSNALAPCSSVVARHRNMDWSIGW